MKKSAYAISLILVLVPLAGCTGAENEDLDRYEIDTGTATIRPNDASECCYSSESRIEFVIMAYNDTAENYVQALIDSGYEEQEARQIHQNQSESEWFRGYNDTWSYYDEYGWEVTLVSGNGTWDVVWLDFSNLAIVNYHGLNSSMYDPTSELTHRGMTKTGSMGPVERPLQTCSGDPDNNGLVYYGNLKPCEPWPFYYDFYMFYIFNTGASEIELEWSVFGWK
jgi:hypothetical protein